MQTETYSFSGELRCTVHRQACAKPRAALLYFHGGGLLYGSRDDLPQETPAKLGEQGYAVITFDYPLAPYAKLEEMLQTVENAVTWYLSRRQTLFGTDCPYFLWGRSAGAYLCLMAQARMPQNRAQGVLSYYGYGFLTDTWYKTPAPYYLRFPQVDAEVVENSAAPCATRPPEEGYALYVHARQSGDWWRLFFPGKEKELLAAYSLRLMANPKTYPPLFLAHSFHDPDVPYTEAKELQGLFSGSLFSVSSQSHDFDRNPTDPAAQKLLHATLSFLDKHTARAVQCGA